MIVAIDGPSAAGKGTLARRLAAALCFAHLDTGLIYRAVAAKLLAAGATTDDETAAIETAERLTASDLERPDLRSEAAGQGASIVAAMPGVRAALLGFQREFARNPPEDQPGAVLDGRDIGTVVCPDADIKLFITADPAVRAERRYKELLGRGDASIYARVLREMCTRDARDSARASAPLKPADDAIVIDTSGMDPDAVLDTALKAVEARRASTRP